MRLPLVLSAVLGAAALSGARAQCSTATQKLIDDKKFDEAKAETQALLKKNDKDDVALHCMGRILVDQNKANDAIEWFEKAVKANDKVAVHHLWLGNSVGEVAQTASKLKQPFMARRVKSEFEKTVELDPSSIDGRIGLIQFYSMAPGFMGGSMDKAKEQAREIEKLNAWRGHIQMAGLLERDKDFPGAEKEFLAALAAMPDTATTYNSLGNFYRRQKRWNESVATFENLLKKKPDANSAHLNIAFTLFQSGENFDRAERETRTWIAGAPADVFKGNLSLAHYLLGQFAEKGGKKDVAKAEYQQAITLNPNNGDAKKALDKIK